MHDIPETIYFKCTGCNKNCHTVQVFLYIRVRTKSKKTAPSIFLKKLFNVAKIDDLPDL